jgi:hypothetical protein
MKIQVRLGKLEINVVKKDEKPQFWTWPKVVAFAIVVVLASGVYGAATHDFRLFDRLLQAEVSIGGTAIQAMADRPREDHHVGELKLPRMPR